MPLDRAFHLAVQHHQAGRLAEAEQIYRQILQQNPNNADALHGLGIVAQQVGRGEMAVELLRRAVAVRPSFAEACVNLGVALKDLGRLTEAIASYRRAIVLNPNIAEAHDNLGTALKENGDSVGAIASHRKAIAISPAYAEAWYNLGNALRANGQPDEAIAAYRKSIALKPSLEEPYYNLGTSLAENGQHDDAIAAYRHAITLKPDHAEALDNLGVALGHKGLVDEAIAAHRRAIALKPGLAVAHNNLGIALGDKGQLDESIAACRQAVALEPGFAAAHHNLALGLLLRGDLLDGWAEYEWRWQVKDLVSPPWRCSQPQWDGSDLNGRTILIHWEQGFGDTIQFSRYIPLVSRLGAEVLVTCPPELQRLLQSLPGVEFWISQVEPLPSFDFHCPLMSLPLAFGTTIETIPGKVPYLHANAIAIERWRLRIGAYADSPFNVGIAWAGRPTHINDCNRSLPLSLLTPLADIPGVRFHSLQNEPSAQQLKELSGGMNLFDWAHELHDFAETAGLIANLDLVISVDTAVAHLAGALGKPVWTLLPFVPDWRWMLNREESPWYPTMRLLRQPVLGDWESVIHEVAARLRQESGRRNAAS